MVPLVVSGEDASDLEAGTLHCAAGGSASVPSGPFPLVLEVQIKGRFEAAEALPRDDRIDQGDGKH
jgi:hypothetical protein